MTTIGHNGGPALDAPPSIAEDRLRGVPEIALFLGETERRVYYMLETGMLPAGKQGRLWVASRSVLRERYARMVEGAA